MPTPLRYSRLQIWLHWAVVLLVAWQFLFNEAIGRAWHQVMKDTYTGATTMVTIHIAFGIAVLAMAVLRLVLRATHGAPALPAEEPPLLGLIAKLTHWGIYALLLLVPVSGLVAWYGAIGPAGAAHELLKTLLLILVLLHTAAALFHQFVLKTNLLARMTPRG